MSSRLIFAGPDCCLRIPLLVKAGYEVDHATSTEALSALLHNAFDAVLLSDRSWELLTHLVPSSIPRLSVPVIVFQESTRNLPEGKIDLVVQNLESPGEWLDRIAQILAHSKCRNLDQ